MPRSDRARMAGAAASNAVVAAIIALTAITLSGPSAMGAEGAAARFYDEIEPLLVEHCYKCHSGGVNKGGVAFDAFESDDALLASRDLWWKVLKNVRAGIMPPSTEPRPSAAEQRSLAQWIKTGAFGIDPQDPDPGRVTIRRLNRVEYRNTIRDLTGVAMGVDFKTTEEFPPDDTGYGFDNIGDVLSLSPLLLEKYVQAAETIVAAAVPKTSKIIRERSIAGTEFRAAEGESNGGQMSFYEEKQVSHVLRVEQGGRYQVTGEMAVAGGFDFDPGRCRLIFKVDGQERFQQEYGWQENRTFRLDLEEDWEPGDRRLTFEVHPLTPSEVKRDSLNLRVVSVQVHGPLGKENAIRPENYDRFFFEGEPPAAGDDRRSYAREILGRFAKQAFRRPVEDALVDRLTAFAEHVYSQPDKSFEEGVARSMVAVLASPRFLFRVEEGTPSESSERYPPVNEYALASRLSYFLWSTMPDEELIRLADRGELRRNLEGQVERMLNHRRSQALVRNFVGQWLQIRDVEGTPINAFAILLTENGIKLPDFRIPRPPGAFRKLREQIQVPEVLLDGRRIELNGELRKLLRQETEMLFRSVMRNDSSILDLIDSDYTFVNERLAKYYGLEGIDGGEMRRVALPEESPRGGVLTQGAVLVVTSNPTRTSPVKRGLFILDNILGMPPPPPPPDIPALEEAERELEGKHPSVRDLLALHQTSALCSSCHSRMDPLGLALENFSALGMWREKDHQQPIDTSGQLISGESFDGIRDLKQILKNERRLDFYRCLTEKLLTYALGRGLEYYDVQAVDQIVERLDREDGRFSALLMGIVDSAPFQNRRNPAIASLNSSEAQP